MRKQESRSLRFVENTPENFLRAFDEFLALGKKKFLIHGDEKETAEFADRFEGRRNGRVCQISRLVCGSSASCLGNNAEVVFVLIGEATRLSATLRMYSKAQCAIVAPVTDHYHKKRPVFVNSIPKSGVHMLFECLKGMGYQQPVSLDLPDHDDELHAGTFYNLQHALSSYLAVPYVRIARFITTFADSVVLFMIRDPRDIAVSLAHYLATHSDYHILKKYFQTLAPEKRITAVLKGEYPIPVYINRAVSFSGNIRDLILLYSDWIKYPPSNMLFIRYEELVGSKGGGSDEAQANCLWRIQLALHLPGSPADYAPYIYSKSTATFRRGEVGGFSDEFTEEHRKIFQELPHDFMDLCGYGSDITRREFSALESFKGCISLGEEADSFCPILVEEGYRGFNIVFYKKRYYAVSQSLGATDLAQTNDPWVLEHEKSHQCFVGASRAVVKKWVDELSLGSVAKFEQEIQSLQKEIDKLSSEIELVKSTWWFRLFMKISLNKSK